MDIYLFGKGLFNDRMVVTDIRRENFRALVAKEDGGEPSKAAARLGKLPGQISHLIGPNPTKNIGNKIARQVEAAYQQALGWLDEAHPDLWKRYLGYDITPAIVADSTEAPAPLEVTAELEELEDGPEITLFRPAPLVGTAKLGTDGYFMELEYPVGHGEGFVEVSSRDPNVYTLRVRGNSMYPAIKNGWLVAVEPNQPLIPGEYVLLKLRDGRKTIKTYLYTRNDVVGVQSVNGDEVHEFWLDEIEQNRGIQYVGGVYPPSKLRL